MARKATIETAMTPEEKLAKALVPEAEHPYQVPENWAWVRFDALIEILNGYAFKSDKYVENGIRIIRIANVQDGYIEDEKPVFYPLSTEKEIENYILKENDLLISLTGNVGRVAFLSASLLPAALNQRVGCLRVRDNTVVNIAFMYYSLLRREFQDSCIKNSKGSAQLNMSTEWLKKQPVPLPPFAEQQRIVDRIESLFAKLDEAKEKAQAVVDGFEDRKAAILHKAFIGELTAKWRSHNKYSAVEFYREIQHELSKTKKKKAKKVQNDFAFVLQKRIPSEWLLVDLDSISRLITDGEHKTPNRVESFCGFYLLSARNIHNDSLNLDDVDYVDADEFEIISKRCNPKKGDILLSCSGSVGRCCVVSNTNNYCMVRSAAMISQVGCNSRYLMYMIQSDAVQEQIKKLSKQTAQANLFLGAIASLLVPLPSREEQDELARILDSLMTGIDQAKDVAEQVIDQIDTMKKSILARAFRGKLGTNDPADESAEELLKRIL